MAAPSTRKRRSASGLDRRRPVGPVVAQALHSIWTEVGRHRVGVLAGAPDALHDLRVGLRRMRALLRAFRPHLDAEPAHALERRLRRLMRRSNGLRDLDVLSAALDELGGSLPPSERDGLQRLTRAVRRRRTRALASLTQVLTRLDDAEIAVWIDALAAVDGPPIGAIAQGLLEDAQAGFAARLEAVDPADDGSLHALRIAGKRARYLAESLGASAADRLRWKVLQDALGDAHDLAVQEAWVREWLQGRRADRRTLLAVGGLLSVLYGRRAAQLERVQRALAGA